MGTKLVRAGLGEIRKWLNDLHQGLPTDLDKERSIALIKDMPHMAEVYRPQAVARALIGTEQLRGVTPAEFLQLAYPLDYTDDVLDTVEHYKDLVRTGTWQEPRAGLFKDWYLAERRNTPYEGFSDVPFLTMREEPFSWKTVGHEGRHRMNVLGDLYGMQEPTLTRIKDVTRKYPSIVESEKGGYGLDLSRTKRYAKGGLAKFGAY